MENRKSNEIDKEYNESTNKNILYKIKKWAKDKINVNAVSPSLTTNTGSYYAFYTDEDAKEVGKNNPAGRLGKLEDTANLVLFLCTKEAEYINGENINVNGGILLK